MDTTDAVADSTEEPAAKKARTDDTEQAAAARRAGTRRRGARGRRAQRRGASTSTSSRGGRRRRRCREGKSNSRSPLCESRRALGPRAFPPAKDRRGAAEGADAFFLFALVTCHPGANENSRRVRRRSVLMSIKSTPTHRFLSSGRMAQGRASRRASASTSSTRKTPRSRH